jgi:Zn-dependent M28 family amino/carboxypeptidase
MAVVAFALIVAAACRSGDTASTTPSPSTAAATPIVAASPTPDPILDPDPDGERALETVRELSVDIGPRVAGTDGEQKTVDYLRGELERYGYDVTVAPFAFDASAFLPARVDAGGTAYPGYAFNGSAEGVAKGPLVFAGTGRPDEFAAGGVNGAIALIERGELTFQEKVDNAAAAGASGVIVFNSEAGALLAEGKSELPVIGVRQADGETLRDAVAASPVEATITVSPRRGTAYNVIAKPRGVDTCETVSGGHHDSVAVTGGADDNASGTAAVLELARVVAANDKEGANCFVLFGAEEFGLFGSKAYVEALGDAGRNAVEAMINLDVVGTDEGLVLIGSDDMVDTARIAGEDIGVETERGQVPNGAGSDHQSFINAGIPAVFFYRNDDQIHTPVDAINRIDAGALEETVRIAYATLLAINE